MWFLGGHCTNDRSIPHVHARNDFVGHKWPLYGLKGWPFQKGAKFGHRVSRACSSKLGHFFIFILLHTVKERSTLTFINICISTSHGYGWLPQNRKVKYVPWFSNRGHTCVSQYCKVAISVGEGVKCGHITHPLYDMDIYVCLIFWFCVMGPPLGLEMEGEYCLFLLKPYIQLKLWYPTHTWIECVICDFCDCKFGGTQDPGGHSWLNYYKYK